MLSWNYDATEGAVSWFIAASIYFMILVNVLLLGLIFVCRNSPKDALYVAEVLYHILWAPISYVIGAKIECCAFMSILNILVEPEKIKLTTSMVPTTLVSNFDTWEAMETAVIDTNAVDSLYGHGMA